MEKPVVELDGDEMTRIIWKKIREEVRVSSTHKTLREAFGEGETMFMRTSGGSGTTHWDTDTSALRNAAPYRTLVI